MEVMVVPLVVLVVVGMAGVMVEARQDDALNYAELGEKMVALVMSLKKDKFLKCFLPVMLACITIEM